MVCMNTLDSVLTLAQQHQLQYYPVRGSHYLVRTAATVGLKQKIILSEFEQQWQVSLGIGFDVNALWSLLAQQELQCAQAEEAELWSLLRQEYGWDTTGESNDTDVHADDDHVHVDDGLGVLLHIQSVEPLPDGGLRPIGVGAKKVYDLQAASALLADFEHVFLPWFAQRQEVAVLQALIEEGDSAMVAELTHRLASQRRWFWQQNPVPNTDYESVLFALGSPLAQLLQGLLWYCNGDRVQGRAALLGYLHQRQHTSQ